MNNFCRFTGNRFGFVLRGLDPRIQSFSRPPPRRGWPGRARPKLTGEFRPVISAGFFLSDYFCRAIILSLIPYDVRRYDLAVCEIVFSVIRATAMIALARADRRPAAYRVLRQLPSLHRPTHPPAPICRSACLSRSAWPLPESSVGLPPGAGCFWWRSRLCHYGNARTMPNPIAAR